MQPERELSHYDVLSKAVLLAVRAHEGQVRKDDGSAYIRHPIQVGLILSREGFSEIVIAAGILHDVLEDTTLTYEDLVKEVGKPVADLVRNVTGPSKDLPWEERKRIYLEHLKEAPKEAVAISIADRLHNRASLLATYKSEGKIVFSRFNRDIRTILENDRKALKIYRERFPNHPMLRELQTYLRELHQIVETEFGKSP